MTELPQHSRVALKNGAEQVYTYALAGSEGWIRDHKVDDDGFELVFIEWDKDHWRYTGQPDGFSFASHFKVIGPPSPPEEKEEKSEEEIQVEASIEIADFLSSLKEMDAKEDSSDNYMDELSDAMEAAAESEGFIMFTVRRKTNPENPNEVLFAPEIHNAFLSEEARLILDVQLAECASQSYQEMISNLMSLLVQRREEDEDDD